MAESGPRLSQEEIDAAVSLGDLVARNEIERIYHPLVRLLRMHIDAAAALYEKRRALFGASGRKTPFVIGLAGSVSAGKSTVARLLRALLARDRGLKVDLVTTDGFLMPNAELEKRGLMERKGFPESYDRAALLAFLAAMKSGRGAVRAPVYSHLIYDIDPGEELTVDKPDALILEGLNLLQPATLPKDGDAIPFASDYLDFSIYLDAEEPVLLDWYLQRFLKLRDTAFRDPDSFFRKFADLSEEQAIALATGIWNSINAVNLRENILPTRSRADLILKKGADHRIEEVFLRRL